MSVQIVLRDGNKLNFPKGVEYSEVYESPSGGYGSSYFKGVNIYGKDDSLIEEVKLNMNLCFLQKSEIVCIVGKEREETVEV